MKLTLDVENTVTKRDGKLHLDPFEAGNSLTMVGMLDDQGAELIVTFDHSEVAADESGHTVVQAWLDRATVLIMHNAAHDLVWLWESGFTYSGAIFDTMLGEYIIQRGQKLPLSLDACAERYELATQKQDTLKQYFAQGYSTRDIPHDELCSYLSADLHATQQLSDQLWLKLNSSEYSSLMQTTILTNQVCVALCRIYCNGFKVDRSVLQDVTEQFTQEKLQLERELQVEVRKLMGDTPINLNSPEQLSWLIFSRKLNNKAVWPTFFNDYMSKGEYRQQVNAHTTIVMKTKVRQCTDCSGAGRKRVRKKDGTLGKAVRICQPCGGEGVHYDRTRDVAGLRFQAPSASWISANGFSCSKGNLEYLEGVARSKGMTDAEQFLYKVRRLSALDSYLSSFCGGINIFTKDDDVLHVRLVQHQTATGRLASREPNLQNMPRGGTFPVKKVFISRWEGGKIMEADFAQLEFRVAAFLSQDKTAIEEVLNGFDVHSYTASVITDAGQHTSRQDAKAHTFAPLYGATGFGRSPAEAAYYEHFTEKYKGIKAWHTRLATEALTTKMITTPSGRQFSFPDVKRRRNGTVSFFTQIKNYPVQSFATADIVPLVLLRLQELMDTQGLQSLIVNTVHDSIVIDVHPEEEKRVLSTIAAVRENIHDDVQLSWGVDLNVPMELDAKIGPNWLETYEVDLHC
jgi:DNA polymerase I-like protein with 3'-5' exonuclease and polymerase domains